MLIISKFKDYYDSAMGVDGVDKTCIYERRTRNESGTNEFNRLRKLFVGDRWVRGIYKFDCRTNFRYLKEIGNSEPYVIMPFVIGFCGKTYCGYIFKWFNGFNKKETSKIVYGPEAFFAMKKLDVKDKYQFAHNKQKQNTQTFFDTFHDKECTELFFDFNVPIFVYDFGCGVGLPSTNSSEEILITNPRLSDYEFYQIMNSPQAFQEIQMFLQGVLGNQEKNNVETSNKDKIVSHGFDLKWSFRKMGLK